MNKSKNLIAKVSSKTLCTEKHFLLGHVTSLAGARLDDDFRINRFNGRVQSVILFAGKIFFFKSVKLAWKGKGFRNQRQLTCKEMTCTTMFILLLGGLNFGLN